MLKGFCCLLILAGTSSYATPEKGRQTGKVPLTIYLSSISSAEIVGPDTDVEHDSLQAAVDFAQKKFAEGYRDVVIRVRPGHYVGQKVKTTGAGRGHRLVIEASKEGHAVFDGENRVDTWFSIVGRNDEPANLVISGLTITRYWTAVTMNGSRDDATNVVSKVEISRNVFDRIGRTNATQGKPSTAVVRLVNSDNNRIVGNLFRHFRNAEQCSLLHAVYVAHGSTNNLIKDNQFTNGCGDAIRFRDASHNNVVEGNRFDDAWASAPVTDWYCDANRRADCTKSAGECPSLNNQLVNNEMVARAVSNKGLTAEFGVSKSKLCTAPKDAQRFIVR